MEVHIDKKTTWKGQFDENATLASILATISRSKGFAMIDHVATYLNGVKIPSLDLTLAQLPEREINFFAKGLSS